ncbi:RnaseH-domain-containing protein [Trametes sanguinea]|nr:RnaseH-domain-containing protein [Trametes sanguinea]
MFAVAAAVNAVPPFAPLLIISDSKYVIDGLTLHLPYWEAQGWLGLENAALIRDTAARLRARSATTRFQWVKGHSGVRGNEGADELARAAVTRPTPRALVLPPAPLHFVNTGVQMAVLTQKLAYSAIRTHLSAAYERRATRRRLQLILDAAKADWQMTVTASKPWTAIRSRDMRREIRDFWWKATHDALRIGRYWTNIPGYEDRARCSHCGVTESLEHILLVCAAPGRETVLRLAVSLLRKRGIELPHLNIGSLLCAPFASACAERGKKNSADDRLLRIVLTESVHLCWKIRCERVIDNDPALPHRHGDLALRTRWLAAMNRRLAIDQQLTRAIKGRVYLDRALVLRTWTGLLVDEASLPEDWILRSRVLVGIPALSDRGVG